MLKLVFTAALFLIAASAQAEISLVKPPTASAKTSEYNFVLGDNGATGEFFIGFADKKEQTVGPFHATLRSFEDQSYLVLLVSEDFNDTGSIFVFSMDDSGLTQLNNKAIIVRKVSLNDDFDKLMEHMQNQGFTGGTALETIATYFKRHSDQSLDGFTHQLVTGAIDVPKKPKQTAQQTEPPQPPADDPPVEQDQEQPAPQEAPPQDAPRQVQRQQIPWGRQYYQQPQQSPYGYGYGYPNYPYGGY